MNAIIWFIPLIFMFAIFYFMIIMPSKKQQKKQQEMIKNMEVNDNVITIGGIHGKIIEINEETFVISTSTSQIEVSKNTIAIKK